MNKTELSQRAKLTTLIQIEKKLDFYQTPECLNCFSLIFRYFLFECVKGQHSYLSHLVM